MILRRGQAYGLFRNQTRLAVCARINQSRFNKIYNGTIKNVSVDTLICICLALGLNENETHDLLACQERAFSPAELAHQAYLELIQIYSEKEIIYDTTPQNLSTILEYADVYLRERKFAELPNANLD